MVFASSNNEATTDIETSTTTTLYKYSQYSGTNEKTLNVLYQNTTFDHVLYVTEEIIVDEPIGHVTSFTTKPADVSQLTTYSTSFSTGTGSNGIETINTIYFVETPYSTFTTGLTTTYGGEVSSTYSTAWKTITSGTSIYVEEYIYVETPIGHVTIYTTTPGNVTEAVTYSTSYITGTGSDGSTTVDTVYYIQTPYLTTTTTKYTGYPGASIVTSGTITSTVIESSTTFVSEVVIVETPDSHKIDFLTTTGPVAAVTTYSTEFSTFVGTDEKETIDTVYYIEVPYATSTGAVTTFYNGTQISTISTIIETITSGSSVFVSEVFVVETPEAHKANISYISGPVSEAVTYSTKYQTTVGSDGTATLETIYFVETPYSTFTTGLTTTYGGEVSSTYSTAWKTITSGTSIYVEEYIYVETPIGHVTIYTTTPGNVTEAVTYSTSYITGTGSDGSTTVDTVYYIQTPYLTTTTTKYTGYPGASIVTSGTITSTVIESSTTFVSEVVIVETPDSHKIDFLTTTGPVAAVTTYSTEFSTFVGTDEKETIDTVYYIEVPYATSTGAVTTFYNGTQISTISTIIETITSGSSVFVSEVFVVETPEAHKANISYISGPVSEAVTYSTKYQTTVGSDGTATLETIYFVETPYSTFTTGLTTTYGGEVSSTYSTAWKTITSGTSIYVEEYIYVETPIGHVTIYTTTPGNVTEAVTYSTSYITGTGSDGSTTVDTVYYIQTPYLTTTTTKYTGYPGASIVTSGTITSTVIESSTTFVSEVVIVETPDSHKIDFLTTTGPVAAVTTYSTEFSTFVGTDEKETIDTVYYIEVPYATSTGAVTTFYNGTQISTISTIIETITSGSSVFVSEVFVVETPEAHKANISYISGPVSEAVTYSTKYQTTVGSDGTATLETIYFVETPYSTFTTGLTTTYGGEVSSTYSTAWKTITSGTSIYVEEYIYVETPIGHVTIYTTTPGNVTEAVTYSTSYITGTGSDGSTTVDTVYYIQTPYLTTTTTKYTGYPGASIVTSGTITSTVIESSTTFVSEVVIVETPDSHKIDFLTTTGPVAAVTTYSTEFSTFVGTDEKETIDTVYYIEVPYATSTGAVTTFYNGTQISTISTIIETITSGSSVFVSEVFVVETPEAHKANISYISGPVSEAVTYSTKYQTTVGSDGTATLETIYFVETPYSTFTTGLTTTYGGEVSSTYSTAWKTITSGTSIYVEEYIYVETPIGHVTIYTTTPGNVTEAVTYSTSYITGTGSDGSTTVDTVYYIQTPYLTTTTTKYTGYPGASIVTSGTITSTVIESSTTFVSEVVIVETPDSHKIDFLTTTGPVAAVTTYSTEFSTFVGTDEKETIDTVYYIEVPYATSTGAVTTFYNGTQISTISTIIETITSGSSVFVSEVFVVETPEAHKANISYISGPVSEAVTYSTKYQTTVGSDGTATLETIYFVETPYSTFTTGLTTTYGGEVSSTYSTAWKTITSGTSIYVEEYIYVETPIGHVTIYTTTPGNVTEAVTYSTSYITGTGSDGSTTVDTVYYIQTPYLTTTTTKYTGYPGASIVTSGTITSTVIESSTTFVSEVVIVETPDSHKIDFLTTTGPVAAVTTYSTEFSTFVGTDEKETIDTVYYIEVPYATSTGAVTTFYNGTQISTISTIIETITSGSSVFVSEVFVVETPEAHKANISYISGPVSEAVTYSTKYQTTVGSDGTATLETIYFVETPYSTFTTGLTTTYGGEVSSTYSTAWKTITSGTSIYVEEYIYVETPIGHVTIYTTTPGNVTEAVTYSTSYITGTGSDGSTTVDTVYYIQTPYLTTTTTKYTGYPGASIVTSGTITSTVIESSTTFVSEVVIVETPDSHKIDFLTTTGPVAAVTTYSTEFSTFVGTDEKETIDTVYYIEVPYATSTGAVTTFYNGTQISTISTIIETITSGSSVFVSEVFVVETPEAHKANISYISGPVSEAVTYSTKYQTTVGSDGTATLETIYFVETPYSTFTTGLTTTYGGEVSSTYSTAWKTITSGTSIYVEEYIYVETPIGHVTIYTTTPGNVTEAVTYSTSYITGTGSDGSTTVDTVYYIQTPYLTTTTTKYTGYPGASIVTSGTITSTVIESSTTFVSEVVIVETPDSHKIDFLTTTGPVAAVTTYSTEFSTFVGTDEKETIDTVYYIEVPYATSTGAVTTFYNGTQISTISTIIETITSGSSVFVSEVFVVETPEAHKANISYISGPVSEAVTYSTKYQTTVGSDGTATLETIYFVETPYSTFTTGLTTTYGGEVSSTYSTAWKTITSGTSIYVEEYIYVETPIGHVTIYTTTPGNVTEAVTYSTSYITGTGSDGSTTVDTVYYIQTPYLTTTTTKYTGYPGASIVTSGTITSTVIESSTTFVSEVVIVETPDSHKIDFLTTTGPVAAVTTYSTEFSTFVGTDEKETIDTVYYIEVPYATSTGAVTTFYNGTQISTISTIIETITSGSSVFVSEVFVVETPEAHKANISYISGPVSEAVTYSTKYQTTVGSDGTATLETIYFVETPYSTFTTGLTTTYGGEVSSTYSTAWKTITSGTSIYVEEYIYVETPIGHVTIYTTTPGNVTEAVTYSTSYITGTGSDGSTTVDTVYYIQTPYLTTTTTKYTGYPGASIVTSGTITSTVIESSTTFVSEVVIVETPDSHKIDFLTTTGPVAAVTTYSTEFSTFVGTDEKETIDTVYYIEVPYATSTGAVTTFYNGTQISTISTIIETITSGSSVFVSEVFVVETPEAHKANISYISGPVSEAVTYSTKYQTTVGSDGTATLETIYFVETPYSTFTTGLTTTYGGEVSSTYSTAWKTITSGTSIYVEEYIYVETPIGHVTIYTTTPGNVTEAVTYSTSYITGTGSDGSTTVDTVYYIQTPYLTTTTTKYTGYPGASIVTSGTITSTVIESSTTFVSEVVIVETPDSHKIDFLTTTGPVAAVTTYSTEFSTFVGTDEKETIDTVYYIEVPYATSTGAVTTFYNGTQISTISTIIETITSGSSVFVSEVFVVETPEAHKANISYISGPVSEAVTYSTKYQTTVGSDGTATLETIYFVETPYSTFTTGLTTTYGGEVSSTYSTAWKTITSGTSIYVEEYIYVETPIGHVTIYTTTPGNVTEAVTYSTSYITGTGSDGSTTVDTVYYIQTPYLTTTTTKYTGYLGASIVTSGTITSTVIESSTTFVSEVVIVETPDSHKIDFLTTTGPVAAVTTYSTEFSTFVGTDEKETIDTVYYIEVPYATSTGAVTTFYNGTQISTISTIIETITSGSSVFVSEVFVVETPEAHKANISYISGPVSEAVTYSTKYQTTVGSDGTATLETIYFVETPYSTFTTGLTTTYGGEVSSTYSTAWKTITSGTSIYVEEYIYVETPIGHVTNFLTSFGNVKSSVTYSTVYVTETEANDSVFINTIYYIEAPFESVLPSIGAIEFPQNTIEQGKANYSFTIDSSYLTEFVIVADSSFASTFEVLSLDVEDDNGTNLKAVSDESTTQEIYALYSDISANNISISFSKNLENLKAKSDTQVVSLYVPVNTIKRSTEYLKIDISLGAGDTNSTSTIISSTTVSALVSPLSSNTSSTTSLSSTIQTSITSVSSLISSNSSQSQISSVISSNNHRLTLTSSWTGSYTHTEILLSTIKASNGTNWVETVYIINTPEIRISSNSVSSKKITTNTAVSSKIISSYPTTNNLTHSSSISDSSSLISGILSSVSISSSLISNSSSSISGILSSVSASSSFKLSIPSLTSGSSNLTSGSSSLTSGSLRFNKSSNTNVINTDFPIGKQSKTSVHSLQTSTTLNYTHAATTITLSNPASISKESGVTVVSHGIYVTTLDNSVLETVTCTETRCVAESSSSLVETSVILSGSSFTGSAASIPSGSQDIVSSTSVAYFKSSYSTEISSNNDYLSFQSTSTLVKETATKTAPVITSSSYDYQNNASKASFVPWILSLLAIFMM
ncbi:hypothetical protein QEN19_004181 [Hanseniaspora menglaensis]